GLDDVPHTGSLRYDPEYPAIPAIAITTNDAETLSGLVAEEPVRVYMRSGSRMLSEKPSYNVIGEIKGTEYPEEIILVGGHLDSWDLGEGAHDDGSGCVQSMAVLQTLRQIDYRPKRTIRCVLFMNEENGLAGGRTYWEKSNEAGEYHMAAIESDRGGFTPRGFTCEGNDDVFKKKFRKVNRWLPLLEPYGLSLSPGGSGADISGLKGQGGLLFGLYPDSQRYFDYHHTDADRFEAVNKRELELGAAAMTALVYLLDKYGL
ncbi:MAG: M28 family peptidase, partial [Sinomicrobium sp.]|nr:M28 family peptidase [Sinomicrobium sp.]